MIEIKAAVPSEVIDQLGDLMQAHWLETEAHVIAEGPKPVIEIYQAMEQAGCMIGFAAFDGEKMVGYVSAFVAVHPHYGILYANHDALFLDKEYRRGMVAVRMLKQVELAARAKGARFMAWHAKPGSVFESMLQRLGMPVEDVIYRKEFTSCQ